MLAIIRSWLRRIEDGVLAHPATFLLVAFTVNAMFVVAFDALDTLPPDGPGLLDLHLANSAAAFEQIMREWQSDGIAAARAVLRLDLFFPFAYVPLVAGLYFLAIQRIQIEPRRLIVMAPFVAGAADWIENLGTLRMLGAVPTEYGVRIVFVASIVKFALLALSGAFIVAALTRRPAWRVILVSRYTVLSLVIGTFPLFGLSQGRDLLVGLSNDGAGLEPWFFVAWLAAWAFSTWYWSRVLMDAEATGATSDHAAVVGTREFEVWATWLPRWIGALTLSVPGVAILLEANSAEHSGRMAALGLSCIAAGVAFFIFVATRRKTFDLARGRAITGYSRGGLTTPLRWILRVSAVVSGAMFLLLTFNAEAGFALGAAAILAIAAANTVFFGSVAVFLRRAYHVPVEALLITAAVTFSFWNDNHAVDIVRSAPARPMLADAFAAWTASAPRSEDDTMPIVIVTAEGGGIRAAHWTSAVLHTLDDDSPLRFSDRLFAISSVSGSSFGAAVYAGLKTDRRGAPGQRDVARRILQRKFLAPMVGRLVTSDFAQWFLPVPIQSFDRSTALEDGFERAYEAEAGTRTMAMPLGAFRRVDQPRVPWLFLNSTSVRTGRRVVLSATDWWDGIAKDGSGPVDFESWTGGDVSLASAAHNTARFPVISAAGLVRSKDDAYLGHLVDGGYFENTGADTAIDLIERLKALDAPGRLRFVVIEIANSAPLQDETTIDWRRSSFLGEVLSPVRALFYARDARGTLATTRLRAMVSRYIVIRPCTGTASQPARSAPLGWQLSDEMVALLYDAAGTCVARQAAALAEAVR